jgi:hypothetical protein
MKNSKFLPIVCIVIAIFLFKLYRTFLSHGYGQERNELRLELGIPPIQEGWEMKGLEDGHGSQEWYPIDSVFAQNTHNLKIVKGGWFGVDYEFDSFELDDGAKRLTIGSSENDEEPFSVHYFQNNNLNNNDSKLTYTQAIDTLRKYGVDVSWAKPELYSDNPRAVPRKENVSASQK